jgi:hypothetical protein
MLEALHIHPLTLEANTLKLETRALLLCCCSTQRDLAACAQYAMPRQLVGWVRAQKPGDSAVVAGITSGCGHSAVGTDFAGGNRKDHATKGEIALLVGTGGIAEQSSFGLVDGMLVDGEMRVQRISV